MSRALTVSNILNKKRNLMQFVNEWFLAFGKPELTGAWLIWGGSGSGKTTFTMMLCKYLTNFGRVAFNSMEEGDGESIKLALVRVNMTTVSNKFMLLVNEPIEDLKERLRKRKAPEIVVIDSLQYSELTYKSYKSLREEFKATLFIIISHAEGKEPEGKIGKKVRYDAFVKIRVDGYRAFVKSRYGGGTPIDIWPEEAEKYHGFETIKNK